MRATWAVAHDEMHPGSFGPATKWGSVRAEGPKLHRLPNDEVIHLAIAPKVKWTPQTLWQIVAHKLDQLDSVVALKELRIPPGNRLGALSGTRQGQYSIRINDQCRICFSWNETEPDNVEIVDYH